MNPFLLLIFAPFFNSQDTLVPIAGAADSAKVLQHVVVRAYESNRRLIDVAAPISVIQPRDLNRYGDVHVVHALNVAPGVRMEERSPGSYRLNIRGSSLRSPFGVRNVKVYMNGVPFTDPGGNSYLNQFDFYNIGSAEVLKGPAASVYGAGTGGVLLLNSDGVNQKAPISLTYTGGSYNTHHVRLSGSLGEGQGQHRVQFTHLESDGYREHTRMRRDAVAWQSTLRETQRNEINTYFFYGDMFYQTPGALTREEFIANPRAARPAGGANPSAAQAQASFRAHTFYAALSSKTKLGNAWQNQTSLYGAYSQNRNPNFRNFSRTSEPHTGARTVFQFEKNHWHVVTGAEVQKGFISQRVYENKGGEPGQLKTDDEIGNTTGFVFFQASLDWKKWNFTTGLSLNDSKVDFRRFNYPQNVHYERQFRYELAPRLAVLYKINASTAFYANVAKGFSAPTTSELLPSTDEFNTTLRPENGMNYEAGFRAARGRWLFIDVNAFYFRMSDAIIQLRDATGGDYFRNAGSANQAGLETYVSAKILDNPSSPVSLLNVYASNTLFHFKYGTYKRGDNNFSNNTMPGVAALTLAGGADVETLNGWTAHFTWFHSGRIALNDANTAWAKPYHLLGLRAGKGLWSRPGFSVSVHGGVENVLNETYSLGNDVNAFGGRYYNAAPARNFYAGIAVQFGRQQNE